MKKIQKTGMIGMTVLGAIFFGFLTIGSWCMTNRMFTENEDLHISMDSIPKHLFVLVMALVLSWITTRLSQKMSEKAVHGIAVGMTAAVTLMTLILVYSAHAYAVSNDQLHVYLGGGMMAFGGFLETGPGEYYNTFSFQWGLAWIYGILFRIFGKSSPEIVQCFQGICVGLTYYWGFRITRELFHEKRVECLYLCIAAVFLPLYLYSLFIYGETVSICGSVAGIFFWLMANRKENSARKTIGYFILTSLFMMFAYLARPSTVIVWIAMAIIQILVFLENRKFLPVILTLAVLCLSLLGQGQVKAYVERQSGEELNHAMPSVLWMAMGLQGDVDEGEVPGAYNAYSLSVFSKNQYDREAATQEGRAYIRERLVQWVRDPADMFCFFRMKLLNQWNEPSYSAFTVTRFMEEPRDWVSAMYKGTGNEILYSFLNQYQAVYYLCVTAAFLLLIRIGGWRAPQYLPGLIGIGGFLFSAVWEAKSRYVLPYVIILLPYFALGLAGLSDILRSHKNRNT